MSESDTPIWEDDSQELVDEHLRDIIADVLRVEATERSVVNNYDQNACNEMIRAVVQTIKSPKDRQEATIQVLVGKMFMLQNRRAQIRQAESEQQYTRLLKQHQDIVRSNQILKKQNDQLIQTAQTRQHSGAQSDNDDGEERGSADDVTDSGAIRATASDANGATASDTDGATVNDVDNTPPPASPRQSTNNDNAALREQIEQLRKGIEEMQVREASREDRLRQELRDSRETPQSSRGRELGFGTLCSDAEAELALMDAYEASLRTPVTTAGASLSTPLPTALSSRSTVNYTQFGARPKGGPVYSTPQGDVRGPAPSSAVQWSLQPASLGPLPGLSSSSKGDQKLLPPAPPSAGGPVTYTSFSSTQRLDPTTAGTGRPSQPRNTAADHSLTWADDHATPRRSHQAPLGSLPQPQRGVSQILQPAYVPNQAIPPARAPPAAVLPPPLPPAALLPDAQGPADMRIRQIEFLARDIERFDPASRDANIDGYLREIDYHLEELPQATSREKQRLIWKSTARSVHTFIETLTDDVRHHYPSLCLALREEYSPYTDKAAATLGAFAITQKKNEAPREYYNRLRAAYFQGCTIPGLEEDQTFKSLFLHNLHDSIRFEVTMRCGSEDQAMTMQQMRKYAQRVWEMRARPFNKRDGEPRVLGIQATETAHLALEGQEVPQVKADNQRRPQGGRPPRQQNGSQNQGGGNRNRNRNQNQNNRFQRRPNKPQSGTDNRREPPAKSQDHDGKYKGKFVKSFSKEEDRAREIEDLIRRSLSEAMQQLEGSRRSPPPREPLKDQKSASPSA